MGKTSAFDELVASTSSQFATVANAPVPFLVLVGLAGVAIWRIMEWRYGGIIARLESDVIWARTQMERLQEVGGHGAAHKAAESWAAEPIMAANRVAGPPHEETREFVSESVTLGDLTTLRLGPQTIAIDRHLATFHGKWAKFEGIVESSGLMNDEILVRLESVDATSLRETITRSVTLWFSESSSRLEAISSGDRISGVGMVETIDRLGITLSRCELDV